MDVNLLAVDDDEDFLFLVQQYLTQHDPGFEIETATSGEEAFRMLVPEKYDIAICDFNLGSTQMNGLEVLKRIKEVSPSTPVIMFTGQSREDVAIRALNLGADYYLEKDSADSFSELIRRIERTVKRNRVERALQASERRFEAVFKQSVVGMVILDTDENLVDVNPAFLEFVDYSKEELFELGIPGISHLEDMRLDRQLFDEILTGTRNSYEMNKRYIQKDGSTVWGHLAVSVSRNKSEDIDFVFAMVNNIDDTLKAQDEIVSQQRFLMNIVDSLTHPFYVVDANDYTIKLANKATCITTRESTQTCYSLTHNRNEPCTGEDHPCPLRHVIETKQPVVLEHIHYDCEGNREYIELHAYPIFDQQGNVTHVIEYNINITHQMLEQIEHKHIEAEIRESENRFRGIFENTGAGIVLVTNDDRVIEVNNAMQTMLGYSHEEICQMKVTDFSHPDDDSIDKQLFKEMIENYRDSFQMEKRYIRKDGDIFWGYLTVSPIRDLKGNIVLNVGMVQDITDRKQAEVALIESEERLELALKGAALGSYDGDLKTGEVRFDARYLEIIEYTLDEIEPSQDFWLNQIHPDDRQNVWETWEVHARGETPFFQMEYRMKTKSGKWRWISDRGMVVERDGENQPVRAAGIHHDITEQRMVRHELLESETRYRTLIESMHDMVYVFDEDDRYSQCYMPKNSKDLVDSTTIIGKHIRDILSPNVAQLMIDTFQSVRNDGETRILDHAWTIEGHEVWFSGSISLHEDGKSIVAVVRNISDRKQVEQALMKKTAELSDFAHLMVHDIRGSLQNILGFANLLESEYNEQFIQKIVDATIKLGELLDRSIRLADAGQIVDRNESVDFNQILTEISENIALRDISINVARLPIVLGDRLKIRQVVSNLIENAIEHGVCSRIEVHAQETPLETSILISNDGMPIPKEIRNRIFNQGFTTKKEGGGLGLKIAKKIVEAHGWTISVLEEPPTTFCISIPKE